VILLGVALVGSHMAGQLREQTQLAEARAGRDALLVGFAGRLMAVTRREALWPFLAEEIDKVFGLRVMIVAPDRREGWCWSAGAARTSGSTCLRPPPRSGLLKAGGRSGRAASCRPLRNGCSCRAGTPGRWRSWGWAAHVDLPLHGEQAPLMESLLAQAGLALARMALEEENLALGRVQERERLRGALLSSIGHDCAPAHHRARHAARAASARCRPGPGPGQCARRGRALDRFVANLLDMVRLETGAVQREAEPVDLAEACEAALDHLAPTTLCDLVELAVPRDLPLVLADPRLLHHCLINLIDNAARHGGAMGRSASRRTGKRMAVSKWRSAIAGRAFRRARRSGSSACSPGSKAPTAGGTGLGLAIVKGFADAMGLEVRAGTARGEGARGGARGEGMGGARFSLRVPPHLVRPVDDDTDSGAENGA
jgi:two-component system sensor histidine kinase KdpD